MKRKISWLLILAMLLAWLPADILPQSVAAAEIDVEVTTGPVDYETCMTCLTLSDSVTCTGMTCSECGTVYPAYGHSWQAATCTDPQTCTLCGTTEGEPLNHDLVTVPAKAPACEEIGWEAYEVCTRCDYSTYQRIDNLGHYSDALQEGPESGFSWSCDRCNETFYVPDPTFCLGLGIDGIDGHSWVSCSGKAATCTRNGYTDYEECTSCHEINGKETIDALDHDLKVYAAKSSSCTESGWDAYVSCERCEFSTYTTIAATGHSWQPATCTAPKTCTICGTTEGDPVPCSYENGSCIYCGTAQYVVVASGTCGDNLTWTLDNTDTLIISGTGAMTNYVYGSYAPWYDYRSNIKTVVITDGITSIGDSALRGCSSLTGITIPDSVTSIGDYAFYFCRNLTSITLGDSVTDIGNSAFFSCNSLTNLTYCGTKEQWNAINIGVNNTELTYATRTYHDWQPITCVDPKTCTVCGATEDGKEHNWQAATCTTPKTCTVCGTTEGELGHNWQAATCTTPKTCTLCGATEGEALNHTNGQPVIENYIQPTCTKNGSFDTVIYCVTCTAELSRETEVIDMLGHMEVIDVAVAPTCTTTGLTEGAHCSACGEVLVKQEKVPALGHDMVANNEGWRTVYNCSRCDYNYIESDLDYLEENGQIIIVGYFGNAVTFEIPAVIDGYPVTAIDGYAFCFCDMLTTLTIPSSITSIGEYAFYYCNSLTSVTMSDSITSIGDYAFDSCYSLKQITYCGTEEQWNAISIGVNNNRLINAERSYHAWEKIICNTICTCTVCGVSEYVGHDLINVDAQEPSCTQIGWNAYEFCSRCDYTTYEQIETLEHDWIEHDALAPTCTQSGWNAYVTCSGCDYTTYEEIPATGHSWQEATCTTPKMCITCGETEGEALGHSGQNWFEIIAPTCTEEGVKARICDVCKETETASAPPRHNYESVVTAPTCTEAGFTTDTCTACGNVQIKDHMDATGHSYESVVTAPTCTEAGFTTDTCIGCGDVKTKDYVDATGHSYESVVTAPTCTEQGYTTNTCTACGDSTVTDYTEPTGHSWSAWIQTKAPTCTQEGTQLRFCNCGQSETQSVAMLPHSYESVITAPTCTEVGFTTDTCTACGDVQIKDHVDATGHSYESVVTAPTCTEAGFTTDTCTACGDVQIKDHVDATGHSYESVVTAPACTEAGFTTDTCTACGDEIIKDYVDATGHSYESVVTAPTCTEAGFTTDTCTACGNQVIKDQVDATGHSYESVVTAPTCTEAGFTTDTCTACGDEIIKDPVEATGHDWQVSVTEPTCIQTGLEVKVCACGEVVETVLETTAHDGQNPDCGLCARISSGYLVLTENTDTDLRLPCDLYVDLNGFDLTGTLVTNGFKVYGMDSTTNTYAGDQVGTFRCVDENGAPVVPEHHVKTTVQMTGAIRRYLAVETENGYSFHRFYLSVTHTSLGTADTSVGYKAVFYGDQMVKSQLASFGYSLQLGQLNPISREVSGDAFVSGDLLTLRIKNYDVENYGETELHAYVTMKLTDGTVIESSTKTVTMRQMVETVNANYSKYADVQLEALKKMIDTYPVMKQWDIWNIYYYDGQIDTQIPENPDGDPFA